MITWVFDKIGFYKILKSKDVIFERSCKLHQISYATTTNYLWLPLITFIKCSPIVWRSHQCAHDMLNNFSCLWIWLIHVMDHFPKWHLGWIFHKIFYIPIFTPYDKFASLPIKYVSNSKVVWCCLAIHQREFVVLGFL
jgi:hypothetical protein